MVKTTKTLVSLLLTLMVALSIIPMVNAETGDTTDYSFAIMNNITGEVQSAEGFVAEQYDTITASFSDIYAGEYTVLVYVLNSEAGNTSVCAVSDWICEISENESAEIQINYYTVTEEVKIDILSTDIISGTKTDYSITLFNPDTEELRTVSAVASSEHYDTVTAVFEDVTADNYQIFVYVLNAEAGNTSLCSITDWNCDIADNETAVIQIDYMYITSEINTNILTVSQIEDTPQLNSTYNAVMFNKETENTVSASIEETENTVTATFENITPNKYIVAMYNFNEEGQNNSLCGMIELDCSNIADENITVVAVYDKKKDEFTIKSPIQEEPKTTYYSFVMLNTTTQETFEVEGIVDSDTVTADFTDIQAGTYTVVVYSFNEEGQNNSLCTNKEWICDIKENEIAQINVKYNKLTSEIDITTISVNIIENSNIEESSKEEISNEESSKEESKVSEISEVSENSTVEISKTESGNITSSSTNTVATSDNTPPVTVMLFIAVISGFTAACVSSKIKKSR